MTTCSANVTPATVGQLLSTKGSTHTVEEATDRQSADVGPARQSASVHMRESVDIRKKLQNTSWHTEASVGNQDCLFATESLL